MKSNDNFGKFFVNGVGVHASIPGQSFTNVVEAFHAYDKIKKDTGTGVIYMYVSQYETRVIAFTPYNN